MHCLLLAFSMLASAAGAPPPPPAATPPAEVVPPALPGEREFLKCLKVPGNRVRLTFKADMEITEVIGWIAAVSCKNFIVPSGLNLAGRKVSVFTPREVAPGELFRLFLALLDSVQLTLEPAGGFLRIIESAKAPRARLPLRGEGLAARDDEYVTQLVRVAHADVGEIAAVLNNYRGEQGSIVTYPPAGTLIITDRAATIERLQRLVAELDVAGESLRLWPMVVRHVSAADLAAKLTEIMALPATVGPAPAVGRKTAAAPMTFTGTSAPAGGQTGRAPAPVTSAVTTGAASPADASASGVARMIPDERSGRLLVVATEAAFARLASLAARLDVPADTRSGQVHAYRCRYADCDAVAGILTSLTGLQVTRGPAPDRRRAARSSVPGPPAAGGAFPPGGANPPAAAAGRDGAAAAAMLFAGDVRVTSDPSTNSLLVLSSLDDFRTLRRLIEEMDVPRKQVFVEATIMEVLHSKDREAGVSYHAGALVGDRGGVVGGFGAGKTAVIDKSTLGSALVGLSGLAVGAPLDGVARLLGLPAGSVPSVGALIQLLQTDTNVDLVANPHLLITNNHEGMISVGQRVPFQAGFVAGVPGGQVPGLLPNVSVNREDVALTLKLTPHVNEDNQIRLEIDQEMSEIAPGTDNGLGPTTTKRAAQTTVFARDQQTIIIGGLMRDKASDSASKVPFLGDIPVLGFFFRRTRRVIEKQNIIIALTPYVIDDSSDLLRVFEAKLRDRRDFLKHFGSAQERRLLEGPLGVPRTTGMLERINRAVKDDEANVAAVAPPPTPPAADGLPLPGS